MTIREISLILNRIPLVIFNCTNICLLYTSMLLMVAMCFAFAACSSDETTDPGDDQNVTSNEDGFKVGAIYINSKNDTAGYTFKQDVYKRQRL